MIICLALCCAIVIVVCLRQRKNRKLASPAYSGIRLMDADQMAVDLKNLHLTVGPTSKLAQFNGNLYVLDAESNCTPPKLPPPITPIEFSFPPPPPSSDCAGRQIIIKFV